MKHAKNIWTLWVFMALVSATTRADTAVEIPGALLVDSQVSGALGFPPFLMTEAVFGASYIIKIVRFDRSNPFERKLDRYNYSFVRPHIRINSSLLLNRIEPRIDIYPLSYFGITAGHSITSRLLKSKGFERWTNYECALVSCSGYIRNTFIESKFKYAYDKFFGTLFIRRDWIQKGDGENVETYDPETGLLFRGGGDRNVHVWIVNGVRLPGNASAALRLRKVRWENSQRDKFAASFLYTRPWREAWNFGGELGFFSRDDAYAAGFLAFKVSYTFSDGPDPEG